MALDSGLFGSSLLSLQAPLQVISLALFALFLLSIPVAFFYFRVVRRRHSGDARSTLAGRLLTRLLPLILFSALVCIVAASFIVAPQAGVSPSSSALLLFALASVFTLLTIMTVVFVQFELRSLGWLAGAASSLARNELDVGVPMEASQRRDELGQLAQAIQSITIGLGAGMDEIARLVEVSQAISARAPLSQALPVLLRGVLRGVSASATGIYLVENAQGELQHVASEGDMLLPAAVEGSIEHLSRQVWRTASPNILRQVGGADSPHADLARSEVRALAIFPMLREGRTTGAMWVAWNAPREFSPMDRNFLATLANLAGIMVESYKVFRAAQTAEQRLQAILANSREGILIADGDGRLCLATHSAEQLLGFNFKARKGEAIQTVLNHERVYMMIADLTRDRGPAVVEIERDQRRLHISATRLKVAEQNITQGWVFVLRDVTEAHRKDAIENDVLGMLAHSMASPAQYARGYAALLKSAGPTNEAQDGYIRKILKGVDDLSQIIAEHQEMSEITSGRGMTRTPCQVLTLATKVANAMSIYAESKGLTLHTEFAKDLPKIVGDPTRLEHAIRNLIDNAIKYTNAPGWIKLSVHESPSSVLITVSDSGIGIPPKEFRRIFEAGVRVKTPETLHIHGTGNGLAIVKKTVDQHGGQVWVESQLGAGSSFHIALPKDRRIMDVLGEEEQPASAAQPPTSETDETPTEQRPKRSREAGLFL